MTYSEWIKANRRHFLDDEYTLPEIINLSVAYGWTLSDMKKTLRHWPRALWVLDPEESASRAARQHIDHLEETLKSKDGLSLQDQWHALYDYLVYGKTWGDL